MVALISNEKLTELKIDTIERAIVLSVLGLQAAIAATEDNSDLVSKVRLKTRTSGSQDVELNLDVSLPFNLYEFNKHGGIIIKSLTELPTAIVDLNTALNLTVTPSVEATPVIPVYPDYLTTNLETYFYYYASILFASLSENRNRIITIEPKGDSFEGAEVRVKITLPLNAQKWALGHNLIDSVKRIATSYETDFVEIETSSSSTLFGDDLLLGDSAIIGD